jgi:hypothetical protein
VSIASKFRRLNRVELSALAFYVVAGIVLLVYLPLTGFPPQLGLLGILSLITAYGIFTKRGWMPWLVFILFAGSIAFSVYTLYSVGFSNSLLGASMIVYAVLNCIFTVYILLKKR